MNNRFESIAAVIQTRRTHMFVEPDRVVPDAIIARLCELATWAPAHKRTWPWRFASFTGPGRAKLGEAFVADMIDNNLGDDAKRTKTLTKYLRTPNVLVVASAPDQHPTFHDENRDAVAAAIQNLLLGATALDLASFWSTPPVIDGVNALQTCGFEYGDRIIGVIYLGYAAESVPVPPRPRPQVTYVN